MNRVIVFDVAVVLMLLSPASAQKSQPEWKTLEPGLQVLRLWESIGPKQPQIAILQLTSEKYKELKQDPKTFVDGHNIFYEKVRPGASLTEMLEAAEGYAGEWAVSCFHLESYARCSSFPVEPKWPQSQQQKP
jgi:hypothetical protein